MKVLGKMSKLIYKFLWILSLVPLFVFNIQTVKASETFGSLEERILSFHSKITVKSDSTLDVIEEITVNALHYSINRGIYRDFPTRYHGQYGMREQVGFKVLEVKKQYLDQRGSSLQNEPYFTENLNNGVRVYIGDEDIIIPTGLYKYVIHYETTFQLADLPDSDQFFYNITGNGWEFPIEEASAEIILPSTFTKSSLNIKGFQGPTGSQDETQDYRVSNTSSKTIINISTDKRLSRTEGFTVKINFPKGGINYPYGYTGPVRMIRDNLDIPTLFIGLITLAIFSYFTWQKYGIDPKEKQIIPLFEPPKDFTPAGISLLSNKRYDNKALTASILSLAVHGYLKINEVESKILVFSSKHFQLEKLKDADDKLPPEEKLILNELFSGSKTYDLKKSYDAKLARLVTLFSDSIHNNYFKDYYKTNYLFIFVELLILVAFYGLSYFVSGQDLETYSVTTIIFGVVGVIGLFVMMGFFAFKNIFLKLIFSSLYLLIILASQVVVFQFNPLSFYPNIYLMFAITIALSYIFVIQRPTEKGSIKIAEIEGFKMYLGTAEAEDIKVMNKQPPKTLDLYQKYLPFAIALSVETVWTSKFQDQINKALIEHDTHFAAWYGGTAGFNSVSSISSFTSSISSSISSASTSSSSSGGSGGGGGGGGGGGW